MTEAGRRHEAARRERERQSSTSRRGRKINAQAERPKPERRRRGASAVEEDHERIQQCSPGSVIEKEGRGTVDLESPIFESIPKHASRNNVSLQPRDHNENQKREKINKKQNGTKKLTIHPTLQTSTLLSQFRYPIITSGARYCRVWISGVKCLLAGVALPRSAILIRIRGGVGRGGSAGVDLVEDDLDLEDFLDLEDLRLGEVSMRRRPRAEGAPKDSVEGTVDAMGTEVCVCTTVVVVVVEVVEGAVALKSPCPSPRPNPSPGGTIATSSSASRVRSELDDRRFLAGVRAGTVVEGRTISRVSKLKLVSISSLGLAPLSPSFWGLGAAPDAEVRERAAPTLATLPAKLVGVVPLPELLPLPLPESVVEEEEAEREKIVPEEDELTDDVRDADPNWDWGWEAAVGGRERGEGRGEGCLRNFLIVVLFILFIIVVFLILVTFFFVVGSSLLPLPRQLRHNNRQTTNLRARILPPPAMHRARQRIRPRNLNIHRRAHASHQRVRSYR